MSRNLKGNLILVLAAALWGVSFSMQDIAGEYMQPFAVNGIRSIIGALFLFPFAVIMSKKSGRPLLEKDKKSRRDMILSGVLCGVFLFIATNFQMFGIVLYPEGAAAAGRSGFITALYVILVPIFSIIFKKRPSFTVLIAVVLAAAGMFLLCFSGGLDAVYLGDLGVMCCSIAFAAQIMCIDIYSSRVDGVKLSMIQFLVCGILSLIVMAIMEEPPAASDFISALPSILYLGIFSCGIAYTLQIIGQQMAENPTVASILMSLESVFSAIAGAIILEQMLSTREIFGCLIMFVAIIVAQLPPLKKKKSGGKS